MEVYLQSSGTKFYSVCFLVKYATKVSRSSTLLLLNTFTLQFILLVLQQMKFQVHEQVFKSVVTKWRW
jgi:hypothetical protein